jgi:hypothetical protein
MGRNEEREEKGGREWKSIGGEEEKRGREEEKSII